MRVVPRRPARTLAAAVAALGAVTTSAIVVAPSAAQAAPVARQEVTPRPSSGLLTITGHGYGHGRGMSQWGAYGAAVSGLSWRQILDFYYPGTHRSTVADSTIKVWITADADQNTTVLPASGLAVTVGRTRTVLPTGPGYTAWRLTPSGGALALFSRDAAGAWTPRALPTGTDAAFTSASGVVRLLHTTPAGATKSTQDLRGEVHATLSAGRLRTILWSGMESYLRGVVPSEMPSSWHTQALAAQSVAARTYAASYRAAQRAKRSTYDICDTTACQVFKGVASTTPSGARASAETPRATEAIALTAGTVMRTKNTPSAPYVFAEFSASNGGHTTAGGPFYQVAKVDPYDARIPNGSNTWSVSTKVSDVERALGVGSLRSMTVTKRDGNGPGGGRVLGLRVAGSARTVDITGAKLRSSLGLKSDWFTLSAMAGPNTRPAPSPGTTRPAAVTAGRDDLDGDGTPDLVTVAPNGDLRLRPVARGGLGAARKIGTGWQGMDAVAHVGDITGDGAADLLARKATNGRLYRYAGDGKGGLSRGALVGTGFAGISSLGSAGDLDGDGRADLVGLRGGNLVLVRGLPGGGVAAPTTIGTRWNVAWVRGVGDLTGDGRPDLAAATTKGVLNVYAVGKGAKITAQRAFGSGWTAPADVTSAGDVTGDGRTDLLAVTRHGDLLAYAGTGPWGIGRATAFGAGLTGERIAH